MSLRTRRPKALAEAVKTKQTQLIYTAIFTIMLIIDRRLNESIQVSQMWIQWTAMIGVLIIVSLGIAMLYGRDR